MKRRTRIFLSVLLFPVSLLMIAALVIVVLPKGPRDPLVWEDPIRTEREALLADEYAVVAGTPWAAEAAEEILEAGGNAFDAAVAGLLALNATFGEAAGFPGVAPVMAYIAEENRYLSYIGAGTAPAAATVEAFSDRRDGTVPDFDIRAQLLPASPDVLISLLRDYGSMSFEQVASPAIELAREGFPVHSIMQKNLDFSLVERIGFSIIMPSTAEYYLRGQWWRPINYSDRFTRPELAETWEKLIDAERRALDAGGDRASGLAAVREYFYSGPIARAIMDFHREEGGLFSASDLADYQGGWEDPWSAEIGPYVVHTNQGWSQGIVVPLVLGILSNIDLESLGHNSPEYVHTVLQAIELAMADREAYVADPAYTEVPHEQLLSPEYWEQRVSQLSDAAYGAMPDPGIIPGYDPGPVFHSMNRAEASSSNPGRILGDFSIGRDTSQVVVVDSRGNAVAITPSDFPKSPMLPEWGLNLGNRMVQFRLDPAHASSLEPGKRPRITPHAVIVEREGSPFLVFNTPGGDMQAQALVQVFLNLTVFGMDLQDAIDAPRFRSYSFPDSFAPHALRPGSIALESELFRAVSMDLEQRGYEVEDGGSWNNDFSAVGAILYHQGGLVAGSDPREASTAAGR
jgi:gamma-glutamyltranspeptidase/glutathione hydrolase